MDNKSISLMIVVLVLIGVSFSAGRIYEQDLYEQQAKKLRVTLEKISEAHDRFIDKLRKSKCLYSLSQNRSR